MKKPALWLVAVMGIAACGSGAPAPSGRNSAALFIDPPAFDRPGGLLVPRQLLARSSQLPHGNGRPQSMHSPVAPTVPSAIQAPPHLAPFSLTTCTSSDLVGLSGAALTSYLQSTPYDCLYYLWTWDANVQAALNDANVTTVAGVIASLSPSYDGTDSTAMHELLFFQHLAYYWWSYQYLSLTPATLVAATTAFDAFAANAHFNDFTSDAGAILWEFINGTDAAGLGSRYLPQWESILTAFISGREADYNQELNAYSIEYAIARDCEFSSFQPVVSSSLVTLLKSVALDMTLNVPATTYLIDDAIFALGQVMDYVSAQKSAAVLAVSNIMTAYPSLSEPYLWCINVLTAYNHCANARRVVLCMSTVLPQVLAKIVPNQYSFEDGAVQVQTALDATTAQTLYHATRQVQSQFSRLAQDLLPVPMDPNGVLKIIVYNSVSDYQIYQPVLFGLSTSNGGIYIEQTGTFYSYQRTPAESIYTLEELFRHEYTHYLIERYDAPGEWGTTPLYDNHRMVWFDEGMAEFLAWSAPTAVYPRQTLVQLVQEDGDARMTVAQIFQSVYGNFTFYHYAGLFFYYLYQNDRGKILTLLNAVRANDLPTFDALVASMAADSTLNTNYQAFLDAEIDQVDSLTNPSTQLPPLNALSTNNISTVQSAFQSALGGNPTCTVSSLALDGRFECRGDLTGQLITTADYAAAGGEFDQTANGFIATLNGNALNNFGYVTCRFGAISFVSYGSYVFPSGSYYCEGPLGSGGAGYAAPVKQAQADFAAPRNGAHATCASGGASSVVCSFQVGTPLEDGSVTDAALTAEVTQDMIGVEEQVYGGRPTFYRNISCAFTAPPQIIPNGSQKYASVGVSCTIPY